LDVRQYDCLIPSMTLFKAATYLSLAIMLLGATCAVPSAKDANAAKDHFDQGKTFFRKKEYGKAIKEYGKAIGLKPDYTEAYSSRAWAHYYSSGNSKAIEDFSQAIRLDPKNPEYYYWRGFPYAHMRKWDKAIEDYNQAIKLKPDLAGAYYNRGIANKVLGNNAKAKADMNKGRELGFQD